MPGRQAGATNAVCDAQWGHAACCMLHLASCGLHVLHRLCCTMRRTPCNVQHTACNMQRTTCNMHHTSFNAHLRHAACMMQRTQRKLQHDLSHLMRTTHKCTTPIAQQTHSAPRTHGTRRRLDTLFPSAAPLHCSWLRAPTVLQHATRNKNTAGFDVTLQSRRSFAFDWWQMR